MASFQAKIGIKNTIIASFEAKIDWKRQRKRKN